MREAVAEGARLYAAAQVVCGDHGRAVEAVQEALKPLQDEAVAWELDATPVARLQQVTEGRLRLESIERSGLRTVGRVLEAGPYRLRQIPGIGQRTADQILAAAQRLSEAVHEAVAVRIDVDRPEPRTTALVIALNLLVEAGQTGDGRSAWPKACRNGSVRCWPTPDRRLDGSGCSFAWVDFELRSAEYYSLLAEIPGRAPDVGAAQGFLPDELAERVRRQRLDDSGLRVSLRGYQEFRCEVRPRSTQSGARRRDGAR